MIALRDMAHRLAERRAGEHRAPPRRPRRGSFRSCARQRTRCSPPMPPTLLAQVPAPVRFVAPSDDPLTPAAYLARVCAERDGFELVSGPGRARPALRAPCRGGPRHRSRRRRGHRARRACDARPRRPADEPHLPSDRGLENALLRAGLLNLARRRCHRRSESRSRAAADPRVRGMGRRRLAERDRRRDRHEAQDSRNPLHLHHDRAAHAARRPGRPGGRVVPVRRPRGRSALLRRADRRLRDGAGGGRLYSPRGASSRPRSRGGCCTQAERSASSRRSRSSSDPTTAAASSGCRSPSTSG